MYICYIYIYIYICNVPLLNLISLVEYVIRLLFLFLMTTISALSVVDMLMQIKSNSLKYANTSTKYQLQKHFHILRATNPAVNILQLEATAAHVTSTKHTHTHTHIHTCYNLVFTVVTCANHPCNWNKTSIISVRVIWLAESLHVG